MQDIDFLLISDPRIWEISVIECHEPLVDIKDYGFKISEQQVSFYDGFVKETKVRYQVAKKLVEATQLLPEGWSFLFCEGHRPLTLQRKIFKEYHEQLQSKYPTWDEATLYKETTKFVAPPEDVPPHSTGGAIDITLLDAHGVEIDMGSPLDDTPDCNENRNFTQATNISGIAKQNREVLIKALSSVGFVNYPAEWWHWSFGDKYWAYHAKQACAIYGSV